MIRRVGFAVLLGMMVCSTGCWDTKELDELSFVTGVGIDMNPERNTVITSSLVIKPAQLKTSDSGGGGGGGGQKAWLLAQSEGNTVFEAIRNTTLHNSRRLNFTHDEILIMGKSAAQQEIGPLLDFFLRDPEPRPIQWVLVTDGESKRIFEVEPELEKTPTIAIDSILKNAGVTSKVYAVTLHDFMKRLLSKTTAPVAPIIKVVKQGKKKQLMMDGTAVFVGQKWVGSLDKRATRGLLWVLDNVESGIIVVPVPKGKLSFEIIEAKGKFKPAFQSGKPTVTVSIDLEGNVGTQMTAKDLSVPNALQKLERLLESTVRGEIRAALKQAQELNADIFGFGAAFYQKYPKEWVVIEPQWNEIFSKLPVEVKVKATARLMGQTTKALPSMIKQ